MSGRVLIVEKASQAKALFFGGGEDKFICEIHFLLDKISRTLSYRLETIQEIEAQKVKKGAQGHTSK